jgi:hypothetical protein
VLAAPLTFNTINKWAAGISDSVALGVLNELLMNGSPIVAVPCAKPALGVHPAYRSSVRLLASVGVTVIDQDRVIQRGPAGLPRIQWEKLLHVVSENSGSIKPIGG